MSFIPVNKEEGKVGQLPCKGSVAFVKNTGGKFTSGYYDNSASGDNFVDFITLETKTANATDGVTFIQVMRVDPSVVIWATCSTTPVQATHVGNRYDISAVGTIDLAATTDKIFLIERIIDATNKIVEGRFMSPPAP